MRNCEKEVVTPYGTTLHKDAGRRSPDTKRSTTNCHGRFAKILESIRPTGNEEDGVERLRHARSCTPVS